MNKEHEQKNETKQHAKPDTFVVDGNGDWLVAKGYNHPDQLIDHDANLDQPEAFFGIFAAYNQHNIASGTKWDTWPSWELCLTEMDIGLHFLMPEIDTHKDWVQREHWLALAQTIHENPAISMEGYTITIEGQHGHTFGFDFSVELEAWGAPGTYANHKAEMVAFGKKPKAWMWAVPSWSFTGTVSHSLGPYWTCPDYIPEYGGESTIHTPDDYFCIDGVNETFPSNLLSLIHLCFEDHHIWVMQYKDALATAEYIAKVEREWPGGRPEDYEYQ
tara:strand:- start:364 stop:1185 length:822 start_codon:yes stop_codon:yes gene_type:complete